MLKIRKKIFKILNHKEQIEYVGLRFLSIIGAFVDMLSVSLIMPLVYFLMGDNDTIFKKILDKINPNMKNIEYLTYIILALVIIFILKNMFLSFQYYVQSAFSNKCIKRIRKKLYYSFLYMPYEKILNYSSGEIINTMNINCEETFLLIYRYLLMQTEITVVTIIFIYLLIVDFKMMVSLALILFIEMIIVFKVIDPIIKKSSHENYVFNNNTNSWVNQTFEGIKEVKLSSRIGYFSRKFNEYNEKLSNSKAKFDFLSSLPRNIIEAATMSCMLLYILVYVKTGNNVNIIIPHLSAFAIAAIRLLPSFNRITNARTAVIYYESKLDSTINQLNVSEKVDNQKDDVCQASISNNLEMNNISFKYANRKNSVIVNCQLEIKYGSFVGIVGTSGVGKTTLVDILLGLLKPQNGIVLSDGVDINDCYKSWISNIGYIPQNIFIINSTIKENIGFGLDKNDIDDNKVVEALKQAQLYEFVMTLSEGINTVIGQRGIDLSGGQKQRIGIARALYNDPQILIFDEATSSLDNDTENEIMESISKFHHKKTMIVISHRLSTIENCDIIYRIENKKIERVR